MGGVAKLLVMALSVVILMCQWSVTEGTSTESSTSPSKTSKDSRNSDDSNNVREKRVAPRESAHLGGGGGGGVRKKKAHNEEQLRALAEFLKQTRQLGVPDAEALALLDKELANAHLPTLKETLGSGLPVRPPTSPVYHATPLRPYGALHIPNAQPYEKHRPSSTPIKEDQQDTPAPRRPIVVESSMARQKSQPHLSPEQLISLQSPGKVTEAISVPKPVQIKTTIPIRESRPAVQLFQPVSGAAGGLALASHQPVFHEAPPVPVAYPVRTVEPTHDDRSNQDGESDGYASRYQFGYRIMDPHSGSDFGHTEAREGEHTQGGYHVLLPDGRIQNVRYWAGPSGFHAKVSYTGEATHPQKHR